MHLIWRWYTVISQDIKSTSLMLCRSHLCCQTSSDPFCAVEPCTKSLTADPLNAVSCKVKPQWIGLVWPVHARTDEDLGNLKGKSTTFCHVPPTFLNNFCSVAGWIILLKVLEMLRCYSRHLSVLLMLWSDLCKWEGAIIFQL